MVAVWRVKDRMSKFFISCYSQENPKERKHYKVPYSVYVYIKQLEAKIKWPEESKLLDAYPELKND